MFKFLAGYKTKVMLALFVVAIALALFTSVTVPQEVWAILVSLGFAGVKSAMVAIGTKRGWQTYTAVVATIGVSACSLFGVEMPIPLETIYAGLTAFGVKGVRDAVGKLANK